MFDFERIKNSGIYFNGRNLYYKWLDIKFDISKFYRSKINNQKYSPLYRIRNRYAGKRCFIIATGPSLLISDLDLLKGEYCFACNSIIGAYESTEWRPTFYGVQDLGVYEKVKKIIDVNEYEYTFFSSLIKAEYDNPAVIKYPLNLLGHTVALFKNRTDDIIYEFSNKCEIEVMDGFSVTYSLFQIAIYLGFKEIIFLGQDCNYSSVGEKQHFMGDKMDQKVNPHWKETGKLICNAFEAAKPYCDKQNIKVLNATRGGMFEVFPRVKLENIL